MRVNKKTRICAFCEHYYDPANSVISPVKNNAIMWEYEKNVKKPCMARNNMEVSSSHTCSKFQSKLL